ncbi:hypothetical protein ABZP36_002565 [Zizania latifolia]
MLAAAISLMLGMATEGVNEGWYDTGSIFLAVFLVVLVTVTSDYKQSLQFRHLNEEKQNIQVEVVRGGKRCGTLISMDEKVALIPWADMLNHSPEVETFLDYNKSS